MRKVKKPRRNLIKKLIEVDENIILDLMIDSFNETELNQYFDIDKTLNYGYGERIVYIIKNILKGNEKFFDILVKYNNTYIEHKKYNDLSNDELKKLFGKDEMVSYTKRGVTPEQMILFCISKNYRLSDLEFFIECYKEYTNKVVKKNQESEKILKENKIELEGVLKNTFLQEELNIYVSNRYGGIENMDFEYLANKFGVKYNKFNDTFEVPSGFLVFFDQNLKKFHENETNYRLFLSFLNTNFVRIAESVNDIVEQYESLEKTRKENETLKNEKDKNEKEIKVLKERLKKEIDREKNKTISEQQKTINFLCSKIEKLENLVKEMQEDEQLEIEENLEINEEIEKVAEKKILQGRVAIVGGKWNSKTIEEVEEYAILNNLKIKFVKANEINRNSESIKNADIVIFDVSYNSHAGYYKVKSIAKDLRHINKSNLEEILK